MEQVTSQGRRDLLDGVVLAVQSAAGRGMLVSIAREAGRLQVEHPLAQLTLGEIRHEIRIAACRIGVRVAEAVAINGARAGPRMAAAWRAS